MKKSIHEFSSWRYLGADIEKFNRNWPRDECFSSSEIVAMITGTIAPETLREPGVDCLRELFLKFYSEHPDIFFALGKRIRDKWNSKSHSAIVQRFLAMNQFLPVERAGRIFTSQATDAQVRFQIKKAGGPLIDLEIVKKARQQLFSKRASDLYIRRDLHSALKLLRARGYNV